MNKRDQDDFDVSGLFMVSVIAIALITMEIISCIYYYDVAAMTARAEHGFVQCWDANPQSVHECEGPACATAHEVCDDRSASR